MASYTLSPIGGAGSQFFDNSGNVLTGGKLYTYAAGTTTPQTTWTTPAGTIANSNPIVLNSAGRPVNEIWLSWAYSYKFVLKDSNDTLIATYDNIPGLPQPPIVNDASSISYQQGYAVTAGNFVIGQTYSISSVGTTDFTAIGASQNVVGTLFTATGVGSGTGTADFSQTVQTKLRQSKAAQDYSTFANYMDDTLNGYYAGQGGEIQRLTDRVFMGGAAWNTGQQTTLNNDWLTTFQNSIGRDGGWIQISQSAALNAEDPQGVIGFLAASQSKYITSAGLNSIGAVFMGVNNSTVLQNTYAVYTEAYRMSGATGGAYGLEIDTINYASLYTIDAYTQNIQQTVGIQLAAGGELSPSTQFPSSAAINIRNNGSTFQRGIIFGNDALTDCDGTTGTAIAIEMAKGHGIHWLKSANVYTCAIYGDVSDPDRSTTMTFDNNGVVFRNSNTSTVICNIANIGQTSVNYPAFVPSLTGNPVQFTAQGTDSNIDIELVPKGLGLVRLGPWAINTDVPVNGYVSVKDSSGTVRKLATIA